MGESNTNIYVKNIDYDITDKMLHDFFRYIGEIRSLHIVRDPRGRSRGFGFLTYSSAEQALRAIVELNGKFLGRKPIVVMLHIRKEERRAMKRMVHGGPESMAYDGVPIAYDNLGNGPNGGSNGGMNGLNSMGK
jgi:RNA recognition motif-containing protein